jgi:hypothetical protein
MPRHVPTVRVSMLGGSTNRVRAEAVQSGAEEYQPEPALWYGTGLPFRGVAPAV